MKTPRREDSTSIEMNLVLRDEEASDIAAIRKVHEEAFNTNEEADLVDLLRSRGKATISIVAEENGYILGHILFSPVSIEPTHPGWSAMGLAPVAVIPEKQRQGIGKSLIEAGLNRCKEIGSTVIVVLGDPGYYMKFGFSPASECGLGNEYQAGDEFMVLELLPGALKSISGTVRYAPEFSEIGA